MAINGRIDGHDPPLFAGGPPGRYEQRLLPVCCPQGPGKVEIVQFVPPAALALVAGRKQLDYGVARARLDTNSDISLL